MMREALVKRAIILFTGDRRVEAERKKLPSRFLATLHRELALTIGAVENADFLIGFDRGEQFGIDSNRGSMRRTCTSLGDRVRATIEYAKELGYNEALIVAGDVVGIDASVFDDAFAALDAADCVIAPSSDGGFSILGVRTDIVLDWNSLPWFTIDAAAGLKREALRSGLTVAEIKTIDDIDSRSDALTAARHLTGQARLRALLLGLLLGVRTPDISLSLSEIRRTPATPRLRGPPLQQAA